MLDIERLDELPRAELIELGRRYGIERPERMTRVELRDELVRVTVTDESLRNRTRGWFGVARDLVASVVEAGLHMPDAAKVIRGDELSLDVQIKRPPVATVTLAEIYAAQGHVHRALKMLDQVLAKEPDHEVAQLLKQKLEERLAGNARAEKSTDGPPRSTPRVALGAGLGSAAVTGGDDPEARDERDEPPESGEVEVQPALSPSVEEEVSPSVEEEVESPIEAGDEAVSSPDLAAAPSERSQPPPAAASSVVPDDTTLAAEPSPPGFQHDLFLTVDDSHAKIAYWELTAESVERGRTLDAEGHTAILVVGMKPAWGGAETLEQEVGVEGLVGRKALVLPEDCQHLRAAIGWRSKSGFLPLAVALQIGPSGQIEFQPPFASDQQVARALDRARSNARARTG